MNTKIKILVLAANPVNTSRLRLDAEVRSIKEALERSKYRDRFELISLGAVRAGDLSQTLLDHKPQIVHFSGHGQGRPTGTGDRSSGDPSRDIGIESEPSPLMYEGLVLEDDQGRAKIVSTAALAGLFELFQNEVQCVVLNACYSEQQATAIHQHIDCVVGMNKAIGDQAAIRFATEFYKALATGRSIEFAYHFAQKGLDLDSIPESLTPVLRNRRGTEDPFRITTAPPESDQRVTVPELQPKSSVQPLSDLPLTSRKNIKWFAVAGVALMAVLAVPQFVSHTQSQSPSISRPVTPSSTFNIPSGTVSSPSRSIASPLASPTTTVSQILPQTVSSPSRSIASPLVSPTTTTVSQMTAENFFARALEKFKNGDKNGAINDYTQAIKLKPYYSVAYYDQGIVFRTLGYQQEAIQDYTSAIQVNRNWGDFNSRYFGLPSAYHNRGLAYFALGNKQRAIGDLESAANLYQQQGNTNEYQYTLKQINKLQQK